MKERMEPLFEHRQEFAGFDTRVLELEGFGPPLLLLHGYADSADTWRPLLAALGRAERRAVAVDLPGFGAADSLQQRALRSSHGQDARRHRTGRGCRARSAHHGRRR
jgi:pimeloyl-ACP methyl ester carboxylesterase